MSAALSVAEALALILADVEPTLVETVPLIDAHDRTLAGNLTALLTQPPFAASAMDGYAVRAADVAKLPATLRCIGETAAGTRYPGAISAHEAVRIFTGAPLPEGADAIVIQENVAREGDAITVHAGPIDPAHVRPAGGDFRHGQHLLAAGEILNARALTLAAAAGHGALPVRRRPIVAILATGNELVPPGTQPGPDQIVSSNAVGLAALVRAFGGTPLLLGIASDAVDDIATRLASAREADILVTTGGASVGDHDLVRPALERLGVELTFSKLAMRPGKPMLFGRQGSQRFLGLPGNPVSALITARVFLGPLIVASLGRPPEKQATSQAVLTAPLPGNGPRQHYMRAHLDLNPTGPCVTAITNQDSSLLAPLATSNALIVRPPNAPALPAGATVSVILLDF